MSTISVPGSANVHVGVYGPHTIIAGGGNDWLEIENGRGKIIVGDGHSALGIAWGGVVSQTGAKGTDSIYFGRGNDTVTEQGRATIHSYGTGQFVEDFGSATVVGGKITIDETKGVITETAISGKQTLVGGGAPTEFIAGKGSTSIVGGTGSSTFVGGTGHDTMVAGSAQNYFEFLHADAGGSHVIKNFTSGDQLYLEGHSLSYLESHNEVSTHGGNTYISLDGGTTSIELKGFTGLSSSDVTTHKP